MAADKKRGAGGGVAADKTRRRRQTARTAAPPSPVTRASAKRGSHRRGRIMSPWLAVVLVVIVALGVYGSVKPFNDLQDVRREHAEMEAQVALLEQENAAVISQIGLLERDSYVEALARSELNLARPGEDVYIVTGAPETASPSAEDPSAEEPGPLEKLLDSLRSLY